MHGPGRVLADHVEKRAALSEEPARLGATPSRTVERGYKVNLDDRDWRESSATLSAEQIAYLRHVLDIHRNDPQRGECGVCHQPSCPDWRDAYDRLAVAGQLMSESGRWLAAGGSGRNPVSQQKMPTVKVGDVVRLEEPDYKYGKGPLLLCVTAVGKAHREPGGTWLELRGVQLCPIGQSFEGAERHALVRLAAVRLNPPIPGRQS